MAEQFYDRDFPNLRSLGYTRTSEPDYYNCIAFVAGDLKRKWWPGDYHPYLSPDYWPPGVLNEETIVAFVQALSTVGFELCADGSLECGFEKAAIYSLNNEVKHAALQQENGFWKSKLTSEEDIEHTLAGLEGPV